MLSSSLDPACATSVVLAGNGTRQYDIVVQGGLLQRLGEACQPVLAPDARLLIITDTHLAPLYLESAQASLSAGGFETVTLVLPPGETSKSLAQAETVYQTLLSNNFTRKDAILGLGGGVIGDLSGFCASTYHRGMGVIHAPTTLVSQVDSAIGGKTAVNLGQIKNLVGTFYQPLRVLADANALDSLPSRELAAGMAEVIKYGLIETACDGNTGFFEWLEQHSAAGTLRQAFPEMIGRCCAIKAAVVMQDELETKGLRFFLNLGHTFGHAYETLSQYKLLHGEAVAIGMLHAVQLSTRLGLIEPGLLPRLEALYQNVGLLEPIKNAPRYAAADLLNVMRHDKKNRDSRIRLVLPEGPIGTVVVRDDIPDAKVLTALSANR